MNLQYAPDKVSICKKDVCVNVSGEWAKAIGMALTFVVAAYGISLLVKAIKYTSFQAQLNAGPVFIFGLMFAKSRRESL